jgi:hypothetical protein
MFHWCAEETIALLGFLTWVTLCIPWLSNKISVWRKRLLKKNCSHK